MPAPFYISIQTSEAALSTPLAEEPQKIDPIEPKKVKRLSKKYHRRGSYGAVMIFDSLSHAVWAHLITVSGGRGVDSADAFVRMPEHEEETGSETWYDYACIVDKPQGGFTDVDSSRKSRVQIAVRELRRLGAAT